MTNTKRILLTACIASAGLFAVGIWTEATDITIFGLNSIGHAQAATGKKDDATAKQFEHEMANARRSLSALTFYTIGITAVSCVALLILWIPAGMAKSEEPKQIPQPTPEGAAEH